MNQNLGILDSNNYICLNFNDDIQKNLSVGEVNEELLYHSNKYIFNFNELDINNNNLYFHLYFLDDCHIKISSNDTSVKIEEKSYYIIINYSTLKLIQEKYYIQFLKNRAY